MARLTKSQARAVRSLVEDSGYSRADARILVLEGMGEDVGNDGVDREWETANGEASAQAREDRPGDDNAEVAWESPE